MSDEPTPEEVVESLRAAGWLLEQDTASALSQHGFLTTMGRAYTDPDDPTVSREIDVFGYREFFRDEDRRMNLGTRVIAECKYSANPYAFIGRPLEDRERDDPPTEHLLRYDTIEEPGPDLGVGSRRKYQHQAWQWLGLHEVPASPSLDEFRATQMTRLDRKATWNADNRGIFTSLVFPLAKALRALQKEAVGKRDRRPHDRQYGWAHVGLFFSVVVTNAPLFVLDATVSPSLPSKQPWVRLTRELKTQSITGRFNVDVVQFSSIDTYLDEQPIRFSEGVTDIVRSDPERFLTREIVPGSRETL